MNETSWCNPELIVAGSDEINRKRNVITRIFSIIISRFEDSWKRSVEETALSVVLPGTHQELAFVFSTNRETGRRNKVLVRLGEMPLDRLGESVPFVWVPTIYDYLPEVIKLADATMPEMKVREHFLFFAGEAPSK